MSTGKWTPTPWYVSPTGFSIWAGDKDDPTRICAIPAGKIKKIEEIDWPTNAHRIVHCVNALEGIENPEAIKELIEAAKEADEYLVTVRLPSAIVISHRMTKALANLKKGGAKQ